MGPALAWRSPLFLIAASLSTVLWMVLTWMPWIRFLCGRTCILLWILYGNMVDFSFIVSLCVSDLPNVTISTRITFQYGTRTRGLSSCYCYIE